MIFEPKVNRDQKSFNPYPILGAPSLPCWPRGLPLDMILNNDNKEEEENKFIYQNNKFSSTNNANFAALQSVADIQPDVDAIYRLTRKTPFSFMRPEPMISPIIAKGNSC